MSPFPLDLLIFYVIVFLYSTSYPDTAYQGPHSVVIKLDPVSSVRPPSAASGSYATINSFNKYHFPDIRRTYNCKTNQLTQIIPSLTFNLNFQGSVYHPHTPQRYYKMKHLITIHMTKPIQWHRQKSRITLLVK